MSIIVRKHKEWVGTWQDGHMETTDQWEICLPHQCDEWMIAGGNRDGVSYDEAVAGLEDFIKELQDGLAALKNKEELNPDV
jgi:hypothetical protein